MKLKVFGGGGAFSVKIDGNDDHVLSLSKGLTAYETAHEIALWLETVTERVVDVAPEDVAPEPAEPAPVTEPNPATQDVPLVAQTSEPSREAQDAGANPAEQDAPPPQAESLEHGSPGAKFGAPGVTDWIDAGQPDFTKPAEDDRAHVDAFEAHKAAELAVIPAPVAPSPTEDAPPVEPPKGAA